MCFVGLEKVTDIVDRKMPWVVPAKWGGAHEKNMHSFGSVKTVCGVACGRMIENVEWFGVEQGLRQGRGVARLLFNTFFAAVLRVIEAVFLESSDAVGDQEDSDRQVSKETYAIHGVSSVRTMLPSCHDRLIVSPEPSQSVLRCVEVWLHRVIREDADITLPNIMRQRNLSDRCCRPRVQATTQICISRNGDRRECRHER